MSPNGTDRKRNALISIAIIAAIVMCTIGAAYIYDDIQTQRERDRAEAAFREYQAQKLVMYQEENLMYDDYEMDVAFIGDSLTDGCDIERYYPGITATNRGIGGDNTIWLEERLNISVFDLKPKVVVLLIGGNNMDSMLTNYEDIIVKIKDNCPRTELVICSLTSMGKDWEHKNQLAAYNNVFLHRLSAKHGCTFVDLYTPLFDETTGQIRSEYTTDGAHLTHPGYEVLTGCIRPVLSSLLDGWGQ